MNINIIYLIIDFSFPKTICVECDNSLLDKSLFFKNIKNIQVKLCDYHNIEKLFSEHVTKNLLIDSKPENLFSDNSFSFHINSTVNKKIFEKIALKILKKNGINRYHFCCNGNGIMYYQ